MGKVVAVLTALVVVADGFASDKADSSDMIFRDDIIHIYELQYYIDNWDSAMEYNKEVANEAYMPARMIYRTPDGDSVVLDSIGVRYKGNSSYEKARNTPKKSFKFNFGEYDDVRNRRQTFFGLERLNFNNNVLDPSYMREKISYDIAQRYMPAPRACYATISVNGTMIGVYTQVEQVDEIFLARHFRENGGNLYKAGDDGAVLEYKGPNQSTYEALYELKTNRSENNWERFINMLYKLNNSPAERFTADMRTCLNLDNCIRHFAWTIALSHFDSYTGSGRNYYMYDDPQSGRFHMIPWDLNLSFGQFSTGVNMITNSPLEIENLDRRPLIRRILENDSLKKVYLSYLKEMIEGPAGPAAVAAEADRLKGILDSAVKAEPDTSKFYSYDQFVKNIESDLTVKEGLSETKILGIKSFAAQRSKALQQLIAAGVSYRSPAGAEQCLPPLKCGWNAAASSIILHFTLPSEAEQPVRFLLYDSRGKVSGELTIKNHLYDGRLTWKRENIVSGLYIIVISADGRSLSEKILITR